jgi:uncharacterized membrane protein
MSVIKIIKRQVAGLCLCLIPLVGGLPFLGNIQAQTPIVHAVLFYSATCPHCHQVITESLIPLAEEYQEQLLILSVDTATQEGQMIYQAAIAHFQIPGERQGVPTLIVGDAVLVGSLEIPEKFPAIITDGLSQDGIAWPDLPQVLSVVGDQTADVPNQSEDAAGSDPGNGTDVQQPADETDNQELSQGSETEAHQPDGESSNAVMPSDSQQAGPQQGGLDTSMGEALKSVEEMTVIEKIAQDKVGNSISILVLIGMALSIGKTGKNLVRPPSKRKIWPLWTAPILIFIGLCTALYMGYVEITQTEAICGPVGNCNSVQQSSYVNLFGILPIGVFGVAGYLAIALTWLFGIMGPVKWRKIIKYVFFALALFGTAFSTYLTFLEPFVIGATCAWCLTSAVVMTLLLMYAQGFVFCLEDKSSMHMEV